MFVRFLLPFVGALLFLIEPVFALFSPVELFGDMVYLVPRFLFMYLLFLAVYYNRKYAVISGIVFGLLYDVFYIDIIGLYAVLYPLLCLSISWIVKWIQQSLLVVTLLTVFFVAMLEFIMYEFFFIISFTSMPMGVFLFTRLIPTLLANLLFLIMLGWVFKYLIKARFLQRV